MNADGTDIQATALAPSAMPAIAGWSASTPLQVERSEIRGPNGKVAFKSDRPLWPRFDTLPDGRFLIAPIDIRETGLWAVDLQFKVQ